MSCPVPFLAAARRLTLLAAALAVLASLAGPPAGLAQNADKKAKLLFSDKPDGTNLKPDLVLRPNLLQPVYLYVEAPKDAKAGEEFTVELRSGGDPVDGGMAKVVAQPGKATRVVFATPPLAPGAAAPKEPVLNALPGVAEVRLLSGTTVVQESKFTIARPAEYVEVKSVKYDPNERGGIKNRLTVDIEANESFAGPKCWVELVVSPDRIPGLLEGRKGDSALRGSLGKAGDKLTLVAENLQFAPGGAGKNGLVYLNVDGYPRAFTFVTTFVTGNTPSAGELVRQPVLRIKAPPFAPPTGGYPVGVEIDNSGGKTAELSLGKVGAAEGENGDIETVTFVGDRRERLLFAAGPRGALLFKPEVQDWSADLDVRDVFGKRALKLKLLDAEKNPVDVLDSRQVADWKDKEARVKEVVEQVILDASKPENIRFAEYFPKKIERGSILTVKASAEDPESGIKSALFFLGKPSADGKIPDNAVTAEGKLVDDKTGVWVADLPAPTDMKTNYEVSVRFTNTAGLSATETVRIQLVDPANGSKTGPDGAAGAKPGSIAGSVLEGDRPQAGLEVALRDEKNNLKASTTTDAAGTFLFKDVTPGAYKVVSGKSAAKTKGETPVSVAADEKKVGLVIKLTR